jgi:secreted PhoX family phosphatase
MQGDHFSNKAEAFEAFDDIPLSPQTDHTIGAVIARRYSRRDMLKGSLGVTAATALFGTAALTAGSGPAKAASAGFVFRELTSGVDETHHVAEGYEADILIRWGDPLFDGLGAFDPRALTAADQARRFGYNNDFIGFFPLDEKATRALLCVNHEYASPEVMFAGLKGRPDRNDFADITQAHAEVEMAAHGASVVEIALVDGKWRPVTGSRFNRRVTAMTEMSVDGPAAGHDRLKTKADPAGRRILGTLNNCAGGQTPWGTYLTAEENFHGYFWTDRRSEDGKRRMTRGLGGAQQRSYERYGVPANWYSWGKFHDRFNVDKEGNEPNRFGWIVEIDPSDPASAPVKHTALGRFRHEGAEMIVNKDGRVVVYSGDDAQFDYVYRFVSSDRIKSGDRTHNMRLLSEGTLSVARYNEDGTVTWLPLVFGEDPLTPANGFNSQADVVIDARLAADVLKATPMDRPEDVQPHPSSGKVFVLLTNNAQRRPERVDRANPRPENHFGHVIEMTAPDGDHAAQTFRWDILIKCGDPRIAPVGAQWHPQTSEHGWFGSPDNCALDAQGRLWISTDQGTAWSRTQKADGLYAIETEGESRALSKLFFRVPVGAELCGPCFTPDGTTLFLAVQHPATDGVRDWRPFGRDSTFDDPATRWPDFAPNMPPRPSVVAIRKRGGGRIAE